MSLKILKIIFTLVAIAYILLPTDLLPDLLGLLGRLDDLIVVALLYWKYNDIARKFVRQTSSDTNTQARNEQKQSQEPKSPYQILELSPNASRDEIEKQYKRLVAQYHPDKVDHLGEDLKKLAHEKMLEIQDAYQKLKH